MRACVIFLCLLATTVPLTVRSKPHGKHHGLHKASQAAKEKDIIMEEANKPQVLPTSVTFDASSQEQEDEEVSSEDNANASKEDEGGKPAKSSAVLLSEEELVDLLKKEEEEEAAEREQEEEEEEDEDEEEVEAGKDEVESSEAVELTEDEEAEAEENLETEEEVMEEEGGEDDTVEDVVKEEVEEVEELSTEEQTEEPAEQEKHTALFEDVDGSAESEIPVDADYAADSGILQPLLTAKAKPHPDQTQSVQKIDVSGAEEKKNEEKQPANMADEEQDAQNTEAAGSEGVFDQDEVRSEESSKGAKKKESEANADAEESKTESALDSKSQLPAKEEEKSKNESGGHAKGKRKQKKGQKGRKHSVQRDGTQQDAAAAAAPGQQERQGAEDSAGDNVVHKAKRRRAGKWGPLVGVNPVQIRATVDLYPRIRPSLGGVIHLPESPADPCDNFRCKRGKTCKLDANNKPGCVCQQPSECPLSLNEFDHVCGTDNRTYETACELFATKCNLEGTKKGHRLHLDYTGSCKLIPSCLDTELVQFPLRMRDWLKNVLLQLFEHDSASQGFLTPKQRFRVKKIYESERRLHAGDHSVELLAQDFEKNYNMYIYPVHWQFAQLDQHPSDRFLSHSELAPLRVPLVPMEHCTSRFFQECDTDKDRQVSFKEWTSCFGIKNEDMDVNLLF